MKNIVSLLMLIVVFTTSCFRAEENKKQLSKAPFLLVHKVKQPEIKTKKTPVLILLHGLGSNEKDLFGFSDFLSKKLLVISARAPHTLGPDKYSWYGLNFSEGAWQTNHLEAEESRKLLLKFIDQVITQYSADEQQVFVGGFSQGAIMSLSLGLTAPEKIKGIAAFSGKVSDQIDSLITTKNELSHLNAFVSHGKKDGVLPYSGAIASQKKLNELGVKLTFKSYPAAHTISQENLVDFKEWLNALL